jgi:hypothetical protein
MNAASSVGRRLTSGLLVVLAVAGSVGTAHPAERVAIPSESPGPPFYMRWLGTGDHEWVVNIFYRSPGCVPTDFNLLDFFDIPRAFRCPLTVEGFEVRSQAFGPPMHSELRGLGAVPVLFVKRTEFEAAAADGELTLTDLLDLETAVMGSASFYQEVLHPRDGARVVNADYQAAGTLENGRPFRVHIQEHDGRVVHFGIVVE